MDIRNNHSFNIELLNNSGSGLADENINNYSSVNINHKAGELNNILHEND